MTVEEQEQLEELTYIGGSVRSSSSGESRVSKESVEADQMTAIKQEERKRFVIRSVSDPRDGRMTSLRDAVAEGIIDYRMGKYINPDTGEGQYTINKRRSESHMQHETAGVVFKR